MKKTIAFCLISFFWGLAFGLFLSDSLRDKMPKAIEIFKDGKSQGWANTGIEQSKIVVIKDNDNPGAYLAFPIYKAKSPGDTILT